MILEIFTMPYAMPYMFLLFELFDRLREMPSYMPCPVLSEMEFHDLGVLPPAFFRRLQNASTCQLR